MDELAINEIGPPLSQNNGVDELITIVGGPTVTVACEEHPAAFVPVTVYVVNVDAVEFTTAPLVLDSVGDEFQT